MKKSKSTLVRRSALYMPANRDKFIERAWTTGADAIILDLEDSVSPEEKVSVRGLIKRDVELVALGGADVVIRVNNEPELLDGDIDAAVLPGVWGLAIPKVETPEEIIAIEQKISRLERQRDIVPGTVRIMALIESTRGFLRAYEVLSAGSRIDSVSFGTEDFTRELNMRYNEGGMLHYPKLHILIIAKALGIYCSGMMGKNTSFHDLEEYARLARESFDYGFDGVSCIHPSQVEYANRGYMPDEESVAEARAIVEVYEQSAREGIGAVKLNNKMIDKPVVDRARATLEILRRIEEKDAYKRVCVEAETQRRGQKTRNDAGKK